MKCQIPEISWHNRDPVLSVDIQPKTTGSKYRRLASGGSDSHVLIWYITKDSGVVALELAADLTRHQRAVNCVRWSPSGEYLASCDDESFIFIWRLKPESETETIFDIDFRGDQDKEVWLNYKVLRGHMEDIYDLSWSANNQYLISGSVDNTAIVWDIQKGRPQYILQDHKGFVQGVAWDPLNKYLATLSSDRHLRFFDVHSKKVIQRCYKSEIPVPKDHALHNKSIRLFHDDTLQTFFRRLCFSPDGQLILVPSGIADTEGSNAKPINTTYIYARNCLKKPIIVLPSPDQYTVAVRFCPLLFKLRSSKEDIVIKPIIPLPYRMIFAVATKCSVYLYDTQQTLPFGLISNIHYTRLTDLTWSNDGTILLVSSTDGYCSIVTFNDNELGEQYSDETIDEIIERNTVKVMDKKSNGDKKLKIKSKPKSSDMIVEPMEIDDQENQENTKSIEIESKKLDDNISDEIKEKIPVERIIKSSQEFSPPKNNLPLTPIAVRKHPRTVTNETVEDVTPTKIGIIESNTQKTSLKTTPKSSFLSNCNKTPTLIAVRRHPRTNESNAVNGDLKCSLSDHIDESLNSPSGMEKNKDQKMPTIEKNISTPNSKTPRRVELITLSTPKSKKKLM